MIEFVFEEKLGFSFYERYKFHNSGIESKVFVITPVFRFNEKYIIKLNNTKGYLKKKSRSFSKYIYEGKLGLDILNITLVNHEEVHISFQSNEYVFIFEKKLIIGIYKGDQNIGAIKQKSISINGLEKYKGVLDQSIPEKVLLYFLIYFNRYHSDASSLYFMHLGFIDIKPRLLSDAKFTNILKDY